jgi:gamma-glutamylcyclotransferase
MLYFAYGSNMDPAQINQRCPSARLIGKARLDNYRLAFTRKSVRNWPGFGVADVVPAPGEHVWGALFAIADQDVPELDRMEGYGAGRTSNAYERIELTVLKDGNPADKVSAQTYVVRRRAEPHLLPHPDYLGRIIAGAKWINAPEDYIAKLKKLAAKMR